MKNISLPSILSLKFRYSLQWWWMVIAFDTKNIFLLPFPLILLMKQKMYSSTMYLASLYHHYHHHIYSHGKKVNTKRLLKEDWTWIDEHNFHPQFFTLYFNTSFHISLHIIIYICMCVCVHRLSWYIETGFTHFYSSICLPSNLYQLDCKTWKVVEDDKSWWWYKLSGSRTQFESKYQHQRNQRWYMLRRTQGSW